MLQDIGRLPILANISKRKYCYDRKRIESHLNLLSTSRTLQIGKAHTYIEGQADPEEPADLKIFGLSCHDFKFIYRKNNLNIYVHKISNKPTIKA